MLLASLLLCVGAVKAQTVYTVDAAAGTANKDGWFQTWTYTTNETNPAELKLACNYNNMQATDGSLKLMVGTHGATTYTLSVPSAYKIVSYSFDFVKVADDYTSDQVTLTVGKNTYNPTEEKQTVTVTDVNAASTTFAMSGQNSGFVATNFNVTVDWALEVEETFSKPGVRKSTFAVGDEMYIYSTCRVNGNTDFTGFLTNKNNNATLTKAKPSSFITTDNNSIWVVASVEELATEATDEVPSKKYFKVTLKNKATDGFFGIGGVTNNATAEDPQTFFISQWNNVVITGDAVKAGDDVWSENEDGTALNPADITDETPVFAVQAANEKCMNTNGSNYNANRVAYPIVFYTVADAKEVSLEKMVTLNEAVESAESVLTSAGYSCTPVALQSKDANGAGFISCSNIDPQEGNNMEYLIDNNPSTFIHSNWHSISSEKDYFEVFLGEGNGLSLFYFSEITRSGVANDFASTIEIFGSADGKTYVPVATVTGLPASAGAEYSSPAIASKPEYIYLRFVVTGSNYAANRPYFHMAEFDLYSVEISDAMVGRFPICSALDATVAAAREAVENLNISNMDALKQNIAIYAERIQRTYPFTLTTDVGNPALYAIKSGRTDNGKGWWYTYDDTEGKIQLTQFSMANTQYWYFKEVVKNANLYLELYPYAGGGSAMSYANTNNEAGNVVIASKQEGNCNTLWQWEVSNGKYGLQTENKENRLSNNGGVSNKMGMWNAGPNNDSGTAMYLYAKPQYSFTTTTDDANPVYYAIKSQRGDAKWFTYLVDGDKAGKIDLQTYTGSDAQLWYIKEVASDKHAHGLQLYPKLGEGKAMSYADSGNGAEKIEAKNVDESNSTWILEVGQNAAYGFKTEDLGNYLSQNGGGNNTMGLWNGGMNDAGTPMYFMTPSVYPQAGKFYAVKSANPANVDAYVYASLTDNYMYWGSNVTTASNNAIWYCTAVDGGLAFKNVHTNSYMEKVINYDPSALSEETAGTIGLSYLGDDQFKIIVSGNPMHSQGGGAVVNWNGGLNTNSAWTFVSVEAPSAHVLNIDEYQYMTLNLGFAVTIPENVKAYAVTGVEAEELVMAEITDVIPANEPVIVFSETADDYTFEYTTEAGNKPANNLMKGSLYDKYVTPEGTPYVMTINANDELVMGMAKVKENGTIKNRANKAYLDLPVESAAAMYSFGRGEGTTDIEAVKPAVENVVIYDLAGRRVEKMDKGIYIVNGRKVVIR